MHTDLKPCPFCSGSALLASYGLRVFVHCDNCYAQCDLMDTDQDACDVWNARAASNHADALQAELDRVTSWARSLRDVLLRLRPDECADVPIYIHTAASHENGLRGRLAEPVR